MAVVPEMHATKNSNISALPNSDPVFYQRVATRWERIA